MRVRFSCAALIAACLLGCSGSAKPSQEEIRAARSSDHTMSNIDRARGVAENANGRTTPLREEVDQVAPVRDQVLSNMPR